MVCNIPPAQNNLMQMTAEQWREFQNAVYLPVQTHVLGYTCNQTDVLHTFVLWIFTTLKQHTIWIT